MLVSVVTQKKSHDTRRLDESLSLILLRHSLPIWLHLFVNLFGFKLVKCFIALYTIIRVVFSLL